MKYDNQIILAAHRGDRKRFPENTMPALENALRFGADMIETDVHMTSDGELILIHDRSLLRTAGWNGFTDQMTLRELKKLDVGSWFSDSFQGLQIPTVEEFIHLIKDSDLLINWELKDYPRDVGDSFAFAAADKLIHLIKKYGLEKRSMVNSFSDRVLEYIYLKYPNTFSIHGQGIYHCKRTIDLAKTAEEELYDWCCLYPNTKGLSPLDFPENFEYCVNHNIIPCVCVPDHFDTYKKYVELGCRMFTSNDIYAAQKILKELNVR